jgi:energy-coupling factor transporter ATP-binding protein EcfA2
MRPVAIGIEIQNYRCFSAPDRATFLLDRGITALVGKNNAGKSALLKFFYELRDVFRFAGHTPMQFAMPGNQSSAISFPPEVPDPAALFSRNTVGPITVKLSLSASSVTRGPRTVYYEKIYPLTECVFTIPRGQPGKPLLQFLYGGSAVDMTKGVSGPLDSFKVSGFDFRFDCTDLVETIQTLAKTLYIGPFRNLINVGGRQNYYDLPIGDAFISMWAEAKTGTRVKEARAVEDVTHDIEAIFGMDRLTIDATPDQKRLVATVNREPFDIGELGSGLTQFVATLYFAKTSSPAYLLIDEPESNLHASLQLDFLTRLAKTTSHGVLFATHSIGLARSGAEHIYSVYKRNVASASKIKQFYALKNAGAFLGELSYSGSCDLGFSKLLLVEGPTDIKVFQQFLCKLGIDHEVTILSLGGSSGISRHSSDVLAQIKNITTNAFAIVDSERLDQRTLPTERRRFQQTCKDLRIPCLVMERRSIECYFPQHAIIDVFGEELLPLGPYDAVPERWKNRKQDNWRLAAATSWDDISGTDVGRFLKKLKDAKDMPASQKKNEAPA